MTRFTETEERQELRRQVAKLASTYGREYFTSGARSGEKTTDLWLAIGKAGYLGINIPEEYGGGGGGIGDVAAVCEELAAQGCPLLMMVVSPAICGTVIARFGTEAQKQALAARHLRRHRRRWRSRSPSPTPAPTRTTSPPPRGATATSGCSTGRKIYISGVDEADERARGRPHRGREDRQAQAVPVRGARPTPPGLEYTADPDGDRQPRSSSSRCSSTTCGCPPTRWSATRTPGWCSCSPGSTPSGSWRRRSRPGSPATRSTGRRRTSRSARSGAPRSAPTRASRTRSRSRRSRSSWPG